MSLPWEEFLSVGVSADLPREERDAELIAEDSLATKYLVNNTGCAARVPETKVLGTHGFASSEV